MRAKISGRRLLAASQAATLLAFVLLLVSPLALPDPLALGAALSLATIGLIVSAVIWIPSLVGGEWPATRIDWILWAYLGVVAITAITSVDGRQTFLAALALLSQVSVFYGTVSLSRRVPWLSTAILLLLVFSVAVLDLMASAYHLEFGFAARLAEYPIPEGWSGRPELGAVMVLQFGLLLAALWVADRPLAWLNRGALVLVSAITILYLYSRTAWVALAVTVVAAIAIAGHHWRRVMASTLAILAITAGLAVTMPTVRYIALNMISVESSDTPVPGVASPGARWLIWKKTAHMIADSPLYGVGFGNFRSVFETDYHPERDNDQRRGVHAHNLWLQQFAELGIPGGVCLVALWIGLLFVACQRARSHPTFVTLGLFLALCAAATSNATDGVPYTMTGIRVYWLYWILFGLVAGLASPHAGAGPSRR